MSEKSKMWSFTLIPSFALISVLFFLSVLSFVHMAGIISVILNWLALDTHTHKPNQNPAILLGLLYIVSYQERISYTRTQCFLQVKPKKTLFHTHSHTDIESIFSSVIFSPRPTGFMLIPNKQHYYDLYVSQPTTHSSIQA